MEELLNKLIEKGWTKKAHHLYGLPNKPFVRYVKDSTHGVEFYYYEWRDNEAKLVKIYSLRDIVSKESGIWQFVCENGMVDDSNFYTREKVDEDRDWIDVTYSTIAEGKKGGHYQYRIIQSALCDEDKLEQFLLNNIKI